MEAKGSPPSRLWSTKPQFSNCAKTLIPSPQTLATTDLSEDSPPAEIVSSRCAVESTSSKDIAIPLTGAAPVPEPTLPLSITIGFVPASEDAMAARSAAGPLPMITTSHDSMFSRTLREDSFSRR